MGKGEGGRVTSPTSQGGMSNLQASLILFSCRRLLEVLLLLRLDLRSYLLDFWSHRILRNLLLSGWKWLDTWKLT